MDAVETLLQPLGDVPSNSSSVTSDKENAPPSSVNVGNQHFHQMCQIEMESEKFIAASRLIAKADVSSMVGPTSTLATTASSHLFPRHMLNQTSYQTGTQYMQRQNQIFVFSTALANKAAKSYLSGHFSSMIAFHCAQPGTKSFLEHSVGVWADK